ncbi:hypothetical protein [Burkholderia pyrrocinia]|uniref:hypothetical protein n=1 Tax=Burkholderia pyrrocinia TaxID=60550 RepID=UPI001BCB774A|nr:hypothetical protein [Burkholderia pyrrocinia]QVN22552.1 hypothetical protein JYG32_24765 [Burkholderia pyrrocinia]
MNVMKNYRTQSCERDFRASGSAVSGRMPALFEFFVRNAHMSPRSSKTTEHRDSRIQTPDARFQRSSLLAAHSRPDWMGGGFRIEVVRGRVAR